LVLHTVGHTDIFWVIRPFWALHAYTAVGPLTVDGRSTRLTPLITHPGQSSGSPRARGAKIELSIDADSMLTHLSDSSQHKYVLRVVVKLFKVENAREHEPKEKKALKWIDDSAATLMYGICPRTHFAYHQDFAVVRNVTEPNPLLELMRYYYCYYY